MSMINQLKQRSDYTHQYNIHSGRHGWVRLTPAYSVKVVEEILSIYEFNGRVLDPFCGSGTTALCASRFGLPSATTDINPFLIWLANVKTQNYSIQEIKEARQSAYNIVRNDTLHTPSDIPPIHNIERWWSPRSLDFLCFLKGGIEQSTISCKAKDILLVAFCRTLINISNAAFNHQSMSFKEDNKGENELLNYEDVFASEVEYVLEGCHEKIRNETKVYLHDARSLDSQTLGKFDLVITSPPYANRMSYIRELRPYMYWLGYIKEAREAGELDWQAIGGTWGIATSRLNGWASDRSYINEYLEQVVSTISQADNKHAELLSRYVHKYCIDIFSHLSSLSTVLNRGARVHYIIGNSTFYGTLVKVEEIYADIMKKVGFTNIDIKAIRKRNSKKELIEFDVSAIWEG